MTLAPHQEEDPGFLADVRSAWRVIAARPLLPLISIVVWAVQVLIPESLQIVAFPVWIFAIGYPGTERLWLLRGIRNQPFTPSQAFHRTWSYTGRFFRLELFLVPPFSIGAGVGWLISRSIIGLFVGAALIGIVMDFALTFVTPALAFTTRRVREALSIGLRMIRSEWPKAALYVLVPPLAIMLVAYLIPGVASLRRLRATVHAIQAGRKPPTIPESARLISGAISALTATFALLFKGATAAFYARRFDVPEFGASSGPEDSPPIPQRPDV